jgi:DNA polymerase III delta prime subunit
VAWRSLAGPSDELVPEQLAPWVLQVEVALDSGSRPVPWIAELEAYYRAPAAGAGPADGHVTQDEMEALRAQLEQGPNAELAPQLLEALACYTRPDWYRSRMRGGRVENTRGVLFYGPPGTGKSEICRAVQRSLNLEGERTLFFGTGADLNARYVGDTERRLRQLQARAQAAPYTLFLMVLEEVDTVAPDPQQQQRRASSEHRTDAGAVLLDLVAGTPNVLFLVTTNFKSLLDPRLLRSGRIGTHILVHPPPAEARRDFFTQQLRGLLRGPREEESVATGANASNSAFVLGEDEALRRAELLFVDCSVGFTWAQLYDVRRLLSGWSQCTAETSAARLLSVVAGVGDQRSGSQALARRLTRLLLQGGGSDASLRLWQPQTGMPEPAPGGDAAASAAMADTLLAIQPFFAPLCVAELVVMLGQPGAADGMQATGRIVYSAASGQLLIEEAQPPSDAASEPVQRTREVRLPRCDDAYVSMVVWSLVKLLRLDHVQWLDHAFVHEHHDNIAGAVRDAEELARCYRGCALIVVDMEEVAGLAPVTCTTTSSRTTGRSHTLTGTQSVGISVANMLSYGQTSSLQLGRSETTSATLTEGVVVSDGVTEGGSHTVTVGSSDSTSTSASAGFSLSGGFSSSVSHSSSHTDFRSRSDTSSRSETHGTAQSSSTARAAGQGRNEARSAGESTQASVNRGAQQQASKAAAHGTSQSASASVSVTVQAQHPQALAAILSLASRVNKVRCRGGRGREV